MQLLCWGQAQQDLACLHVNNAANNIYVSLSTLCASGLIHCSSEHSCLWFIMHLSGPLNTFCHINIMDASLIAGMPSYTQVSSALPRLTLAYVWSQQMGSYQCCSKHRSLVMALLCSVCCSGRELMLMQLALTGDKTYIPNFH